MDGFLFYFFYFFISCSVLPFLLLFFCFSGPVAFVGLLSGYNFCQCSFSPFLFLSVYHVFISLLYSSNYCGVLSLVIIHVFPINLFFSLHVAVCTCFPSRCPFAKLDVCFSHHQPTFIPRLFTSLLFQFLQRNLHQDIHELRIN